MLALLQIMFLDNANLIYRPLIEGSPLLLLYFLAFFLMCPIALLNIVTAIMVESSLRTANEDVEASKAWKASQRRQMMPELYNVFATLDKDGSGQIDLEEFFSSPPELKERIASIVDMTLLTDIFHLLDVDGSGTLSIDEFVDGIMRSCQEDKPPELLLLLKQSRKILSRLERSYGHANFQKHRKMLHRL